MTNSGVNGTDYREDLIVEQDCAGQRKFLFGVMARPGGWIDAGTAFSGIENSVAPDALVSEGLALALAPSSAYVFNGTTYGSRAAILEDILSPSG